jgi:hypothetical protein
VKCPTQISTLGMGLYFLALLSLCHHFQFEEIFFLAHNDLLLLSGRETCNSHSESNLLRRLNGLENNSLWDFRVFLRVTIHQNHFQCDKTFILIHNGLLCYLSEKLATAILKPPWLEGQCHAECSNMGIESVFHRLSSIYNNIQFEEIFILACNVLLYCTTKKYVTSFVKPS